MAKYTMKQKGTYKNKHTSDTEQHITARTHKQNHINTTVPMGIATNTKKAQLKQLNKRAQVIN